MKGHVPTARHLICDRSDPNLDFTEKEDSILINGSELKKPFVEKPFDGDDHNICIYYHSAFGGGRQELFRKIGNQSSTYSSTRKRSLNWKLNEQKSKLWFGGRLTLKTYSWSGLFSVPFFYQGWLSLYDF